MPDQGLPHFDDMLGNYEYGRELCINEFGIIPSIAWTIDAFGQSAYQNRLFSELGYHTVVTNRVPYKFKTMLKHTKDLEFRWVGALPEHSMATIVLHGHYNTGNFFENIGPMSMSSSEFRLLHYYYISQVLYEDASNDNVGNHTMIFNGDDFYFLPFEPFYSMLKIKYWILRSNSRSLFNGSTWRISTIGEYIEIKSKERHK